MSGIVYGVHSVLITVLPLILRGILIVQVNPLQHCLMTSFKFVKYVFVSIIFYALGGDNSLP